MKGKCSYEKGGTVIKPSKKPEPMKHFNDQEQARMERMQTERSNSHSLDSTFKK